MKINFVVMSAIFLLAASLFWGLASAAEQTADAATSPVPVNTYYVSRYAPGASDSNPGTKTQPWSTIQHATSVVQPGDTVIVEAMYYTDRIYLTTSGTVSAPIKFIADGYVTTQGFTIEADYNHVIGFKIEDTPAVDGPNAFQRDCTGIFVRGIGNQVSDNHIYDTTCVGIRVYASPVNDPGTRDNLIYGNKVELAKDAGIAIFGKNNRIEKNEVVRTVQKSDKWTNNPRLDADGFRFHGEGHEFIGNHIHGISFDDPLNWQYDDPIDKIVFVPHIDCFQSWNPVRNILIEGNVCEINSPNGKRFHYVIAQASTYEEDRNGDGTPEIYHKEVQELTIRNNIFRSDSTGFGAIVLQGMARTSDLWFERRGVYVKDVVIAHNTFVRTNGLGDHAIWLRYVEDAVVQNNIFYDHNNHSANAYIYCGDSTYSSITCVDDHYQNDGVKRTINLQAGWNLVYQSSGIPSGTAYPNDLWQVDPEFVGFDSQDYHLQPISPAIDAGVDIGVSRDFDGTSRPQFAGYDMGAFESTDIATPTPSITPSPTFTTTATPTIVTITPSITSSPIFSATVTPTLGTITPSVTPAPTLATPEPIFEDVPEHFWAYPEIEQLYEDGYLSGVSSDPMLFGTGRGLTRGEGAVFVVRGVDGVEFDPSMPAVPPFDDVPISHWAVEWVNRLELLGFTDGCGVNDGGEVNFCVDFNYTRAEAAVHFVRMLEGPDFVPPTPDPNHWFKYGDVAADDSLWYNKWVYYAWELGITHYCEAPEGTLDDLFRPNDTILREEAACMMYNAIYAGGSK